MVSFKFNVGDEVKDKVTGFVGIVISCCYWLNNCNTYGIKNQKLKEDGTPQKLIYFDEPDLEFISKGIFKKERDTGGPCDYVPQTNR